MSAPNEKRGDGRRSPLGQPSREESKSTQATLNEEEDDIASIYSLQENLNEYIERNESTAYHELYPGVEMLNYNFTEERQHVFSTNLVESTAHLIKGCLGAGVLSMHEAYMQGGLWTSLGMTIFFGIIVPHGMLTLVNSAHKMYVRLRVPRLSYPDLAEVALATGPLRCCRKYSKAFRYTVDTFLFFELCGNCCIYQIIIASTVKEVLEAISPTVASWQFHARLYILITAVPLLFLSLIRNLKCLAPLSLIADIFVANVTFGRRFLELCYSLFLHV